MPKASELKRGQVIDIDGKLMLVQQIDVRNPTARGASTLYRVRFSQIPGGGKHEATYVGDDIVKDVALERRQCSYLYREDDLFYFMDAEDYSQYGINADVIEDQLPYLIENMEGIMVSLVDGQAISIQLPSIVVMEIVETVPGMKAASATGRTKAARFANGLEIQVPEYLETGEKVKINTETGKFSSRA
ncbi:MAG: elongation factor P-like protein YeiP [Oceanospirillaceae bacterium]|uniref:elongation factor P-like protein EfpL n=1 Tax=Marinobacterium litorale TaxID=404770 RepID=UPI0003F98DD8|nr:elongation factor P-like protein YeiP [Marinobacterium litorale]MBS99187.1 elongation factor P-like protein YeiP [Oceanospirillaceae bacterium]